MNLDRKNFYNKYTQNDVNIDIKRKNEDSKDENLYVMEKLSLEERKLRNALTKAGLTKYENLAKDYSDLLKEDENNKKLMKDYEEKFGIKPSDEQFEDYKLNNETFIRDEKDIIKDNIYFNEGEDEDEVYGT